MEAAMNCTVSQEWLDKQMEELGRLRAENEGLRLEAESRQRDLLALIQQLPKREESGERLTASDFAAMLERELRR